MAAAVYASQGYIVAAPNYVGYDVSATSPHPYIIKAQQGQEMIDAVRAARLALTRTQTPPSVTDSGKLFLAGNSQGGFVTMAAQQAMEQAGIPVAAISAGSGPFAIAAQVDYTFMGQPGFYGARVGELLFQSYQAVYGNVYQSPSEMMTDGYFAAMRYASAAEDAGSVIQATTPMFSALAPLVSDLPATAPTSLGADRLTALFAASVPAGAVNRSPDPQVISEAVWQQLFDPTANFALANAGVSSAYFTPTAGHAVRQSYRAAYLADAYSNPDGYFQFLAQGMPSATAKNGLRANLAHNDLRGHVPIAPTLLCGTNEDAVVYFDLNTRAMQARWGEPISTRFTLDLASLPTQDGDLTAPFNGLRAGYAATQASLATAAGGGARGAAAARAQSHISATPFCAVAARAFFARF